MTLALSPVRKVSAKSPSSWLVTVTSVIRCTGVARSTCTKRHSALPYWLSPSEMPTAASIVIAIRETVGRRGRIRGVRMAEFDQLPPAEAEAALLACCASPRWARRVAAARPYGGLDALLDRADAELADLDEP